MAVKTIASLSDLTHDDANPNLHTIRGHGSAERSILECGIGRSIVVDRNGKIVAGNQVVETLGEINQDLIDVKVVRTVGDKLVIVQRVDLDLDNPEDDRARKLAILDNKVSEDNLRWDLPVLAARASEGIPVGDYFTVDEMRSLFDAHTARQADLDEPLSEAIEALERQSGSRKNRQSPGAQKTENPQNQDQNPDVGITAEPGSWIIKCPKCTSEIHVRKPNG